MTLSRTLVLTGTGAVLALCAITGLAPAASAVDTTTTCTRDDRVALRQEILDLHEQIDALRLTPEQVATAKAAHRKAIDDLRAEYGLPGATLTGAERADLKAKVAALKADARDAAAARRAKIDPLKAQLLADRSELAACRAAAASQG